MSSIYVSSERFGTITVTLDDVFRNHEVLLDLVDGLALPEFFTLFRKPLPFTALVVLVENLLLPLLELHVGLSLIKKLILWNWSCL